MNLATIIAISVFFFFVILEAAFSAKKELKLYHGKDTFNNLSLGILTFLTTIAMKSGLLAIFFWLKQFTIFDIPRSSILGLIVLFILNDFLFYVYHRLSHESRLFWAFHVVHHSSEYFNITTSMRGLFLMKFYRFIFWIPLVFLGFDPVLILLMDSIAFFYQFWIHTETIDKLHPAVEYVLNTPSHHRVHHGSNPQYLDKNYAAVFIIWDRLFGSFEPEKEKVVYGLTKNIDTYNTVKVAFHELVDLWKDLKKPGTFQNKLNYLFNRPGWRPERENKQPPEAPPVVRRKKKYYQSKNINPMQSSVAD